VIFSCVPPLCGAIGYSAAVLSQRSRERDIERERQRLTTMLDEASLMPGSDHPPVTQPPASDPSDEDNLIDSSLLTGRRTGDPRDDRFTPLLIEYYAYGLVQAKRHSMTSLTMSTIGGAIILVGVIVMLWRAHAGGSIVAAGLATGAGIVSNAMAALFHRQSNQALKHMQAQTVVLRDDMRNESEARQALEQLEKITDANLRDRLRLGIVLRLSGAELPDLSLVGSQD
jgi:hypothetical protein